MSMKRIASAVFALFAALTLCTAAQGEESLAPADTGVPVTSLVNVAMGIELEMISGTLPADTQLMIARTDSNKEDEMMSLVITLSSGEKEIQPNGIVTLKIPLDEKILTKKNLYVYRIENEGSYTFIDSTVKDGIIVFNTDHFSKFIISARKLSKDGSPDTGIVLATAPALLAACGVLVTAKKRKK